MIDTTTINFAIAKLQSAFNSIQPNVSGYTEQFIQYKVFEQIIYNIIALVAIVICALLYIPVHKYGKGKPDERSNYEEGGYILPTVILGLIIFISSISFVLMIPNTILALKFPVMFTIQSLVK